MLLTAEEPLHSIQPLLQRVCSALLCSRYLLFMKLAALQLMQQKASKVETPTSLENGSPSASADTKSEDSIGPEAGSEEEGSSVSGLAKVKELAETIASDDGTGGVAVLVGESPAQFWQHSHGWLMSSERQADICGVSSWAGGSR